MQRVEGCRKEYTIYLDDVFKFVFCFLQLIVKEE